MLKDGQAMRQIGGERERDGSIDNWRQTIREREREEGDEWINRSLEKSITERASERERD